MVAMLKMQTDGQDLSIMSPTHAHDQLLLLLPSYVSIPNTPLASKLDTSYPVDQCFIPAGIRSVSQYHMQS
jgi:hypothetical protein